MTQENLAWLPRARRHQFTLQAALVLTAMSALPARAATFTVVNTSDSGTGSLRQALISSNTNAGQDTIVFQVPGTGVKTISPVSALPSIVDSVIIDATTQPGYAGKPLIELNGTSAGNNTGLRVFAGNSTIRGLAINRFKGAGIQVEGTGTNVIQGNFIGTDATGTLRRGNASDGILISGSSWNRIGGTNAQDRNVLSANGDGGVYFLNSCNNELLGNYIGTTASGTAALGNTNSGVIVNSTSGGVATNNVIGSDRAAGRNLISGNAVNGVVLNGVGTRENVIRGNYIGTDLTGTVSVGNGGDGVDLSEASGTVIGGSGAGHGNLLAGNRQNGVAIRGLGATNNWVQGNLIGVDATGRLALANTNSGVVLSGANCNQVGGTNAGEGNVISANVLAGIFLESGSSNNVVVGNYIGTDAAGTNRLGNGANGISLNSSRSNQIGGTVAGARNLISGNASHGIQVYGAGASNNLIAGNFLGTDVTGKSSLSNSLYGVHVKSSGNVIGGTLSGAGNLISGNGQHGLVLEGTEASNNVVQGNFVGTDVDGTGALKNRYSGIVVVDAPRNMIGGFLGGAGNLVSGNGDAGIYLTNSNAKGNEVLGNTVGTDISGMLALGNAREGIYSINAPSNSIGGFFPGAVNLISGNGTRGIYLVNSPGYSIQCNLIGVKRDGVTDLGHRYHAVECEVGSSHTAVSFNRIGFCRTVYCGVRMRDGSTNNTVVDNAIFANGGLGIDLGNAGVAMNDGCDTDSGANQLQNYPVLGSAVVGPDSITISGTLNSVPNSSFLIQFFANASRNSSGYGEGEIFLGQTSVRTGTDCEASFQTTFSVAFPIAGYFIAATATDAAGNTSEFSACQPVTLPASVTLGDLAATYDGTPKAVSVSTSPANLAVAVTYDGGLVVPVNAGAYGVVATVTDSGYQGVTNGTLVIARAAQTITFGPIPDQVYGVAPLTLTATASSGLPVSFELVSGPASLSGAELTLTGAGVVTVRAIQAGNGNYLAATPVSQSFTVTKVVPPMSVTATANGQLILSWPASSLSDFILKETTSLVPPVSWVAVQTTGVLKGGRVVVVLPIGSGREFYTLTAE